MKLTCALTIDVEEYFQIHALSDVVRRKDWNSFQSRVEKSTYRILDILDCVEDRRSEVEAQKTEDRRQKTEDRGQRAEDRGQRAEGGGQRSEVRGQRTEDRRQKTTSGTQKTSKIHKRESDADSRLSTLPAEPYPVRATFFVLGWIAERYPGLVREIHSRGHEVACHGYTHRLVSSQTRKEFKEDVSRAKGILEDLTGAEIIGYRAPTFSITSETLCALELLFELGFRYDSSIFPIKHDFYGIPRAPRYPFVIDFSDSNLVSQLKNPKYLRSIDNNSNCGHEQPNDSRPSDLFIEFPLTTVSVLGLNLPCSGGGYFRTFPYWFTRWGLQRIYNNGLGTAIFYLHPWELDPDFPLIKGSSRRARFRTYINLEKTESRFKRLLKDFRFVSLSSLL